MSTALLDQLIDRHGGTWLAAGEIDAFVAAPGMGLLFVTGDPVTNLETNDVAVILSELIKTFPGAFRLGLVERAAEQSVRKRFEVWATPSMIFVRNGAMAGALPQVRDWDDYLAEFTRILGMPLRVTSH